MVLQGFYHVVIMPVAFKSNFLMLFNALENLIILVFVQLQAFLISKSRKVPSFFDSADFVFFSFALIGIITPVMGVL
jgi:hypothetical protein